jgi:hypothetical protein
MLHVTYLMLVRYLRNLYHDSILYVVEACGGFRTLVSRNTKDRELRMASRGIR